MTVKELIELLQKHSPDTVVEAIDSVGEPVWWGIMVTDDGKLIIFLN